MCVLCDDVCDDDEFCDVLLSEVYGFVGMVFMMFVFVFWFVGVFVSEVVFEWFGVLLGVVVRYYVCVLLMWFIVSCLYVFVGYECLNLMSTLDDAATMFGATDSDLSEYVLDGGRCVNEMFDLDEGLWLLILLFWDIL